MIALSDIPGKPCSSSALQTFNLIKFKASKATNQGTNSHLIFTNMELHMNSIRDTP